jgi:hypothetical protein
MRHRCPLGRPRRLSEHLRRRLVHGRVRASFDGMRDDHALPRMLGAGRLVRDRRLRIRMRGGGVRRRLPTRSDPVRLDHQRSGLRRPRPMGAEQRMPECLRRQRLHRRVCAWSNSMLLGNTAADLQRARPIPRRIRLPIRLRQRLVRRRMLTRSRRCSPGNGVPEFCGSNGIWQSQAPCQFICSGSGSCGGECAPGSRRCSPVSGVPQLCSQAGAWQNQAACPFICSNGVCGGECSPGSRRCDPASGVPQLCGNGGSWQNQQGCARGCQGGSCIPQAGLGASCGSATDCLSGFCTDGVCCESACGGVCAQCQPGTGACIAPASDQACPTVTCPSNECQTANGNLTTNLCRARGQCKDQTDCSFSRFDRGTPCDTADSDFRFCDGQGRCVDPAVSCNGVAGRVVSADNVCCSRRDGLAPPYSLSESFGPTADCDESALSSPGGTPVTCDDDNDCRIGMLCCQSSAPGGGRISCQMGVRRY